MDWKIDNYPEIVTDAGLLFSVDAVSRILSHLLPPSFFEGEAVAHRLNAQMPIISWTPLLESPFDLSLFLCCRFRPNAFRFFYEMVSRWLIPGKRMNATVQFATDFCLPEISSQKFIGGEVMVRIDNQKELETLQKNLPIIESEIRLGVDSHYQACRILEIKGLTADEKTAFIQEFISSLIRQRPQNFDFDILSDMQHFLVLCKESFKAARSYRHMSRIICVQYLFQRALKTALDSYPERRYISVKLMRARLHEKKSVLGIVLGLSFIRDDEVFEARHILSGIQALVPEAKKVKGSFFANRTRADSICTFYLEVEKEGGFTSEEHRRLKEELPDELQNRFEQRINRIFMPQNEEVVMRHILTLSQQLKYVRDLPQVIIDFNQQTEDQLEFLVVALRVQRPKQGVIADCFEKKATFLEFLPDRKKYVGLLRKKHKKEANVFRLRIHKTPFLRKNLSIDLHRARKDVAAELARVIGDFRDYNGGTILKETELFDELKMDLGDLAAKNGFLLENFFYALNPPVMRSVLPAEPLKRLFTMLTKQKLHDDEPVSVQIEEDADYFYALITSSDPHLHEALSLDGYRGEMATCFVPQTERYSFGLICRAPTEEDALKLRLAIDELLAAPV